MFRMCMVESNILTGTYWTCGQCCLLCMMLVCYNIVIGRYILDMMVSVVCSLCVWWNLIYTYITNILDMWSVLFVMYDVGMF